MTSEAPYRALVEHSPEAAYVVRDGRIVFMNPAAVRMFGAPLAEALLETDILDRVHPDDHALALARRKRVLELNVPAPLVEMRFIALDATRGGGAPGRGIAHDFNNTLAVILGHTEFALQELPPHHPLHHDILAIERAAQHSAALTRQLLTYARRQTVRPRSLDLNQAVTETMRMLRPLVGENIHLAWSPAEDLWPITLDPA